MHPISEDMIERFLLAPNEMDAAELTRVISHVARCESCRQISEMMRHHYAELDGNDASISESLERLMAQIFCD